MRLYTKILILFVFCLHVQANFVRADLKLVVDSPERPLLLGTYRIFRILEENDTAPFGVATTQWWIREGENDNWITWDAGGNPATSADLNLRRWGSFQARCYVTFLDPGMGEEIRQDEDVRASFSMVGPDDMKVIAGTEVPCLNVGGVTVIYQLPWDSEPIGSEFDGWAQERIDLEYGSDPPPLPNTWSPWDPATYLAYQNQSPLVFFKNFNVILDYQRQFPFQSDWETIGDQEVYITYDQEIRMITADWNGDMVDFSKVFHFQRKKVSIDQWQIEERAEEE